MLQTASNTILTHFIEEVYEFTVIPYHDRPVTITYETTPLCVVTLADRVCLFVCLNGGLQVIGITDIIYPDIDASVVMLYPHA